MSDSNKISAALVKQLRDLSGAKMMDCKRALESTNGDIAAAQERMQKDGQATADKRSGRVATEGIVVISSVDTMKKSYMLEINCETDFVARDGNFISYVNELLESLKVNQPNNLEELLQLNSKEGRTFEEYRHELVSKLGENIQLRRLAILESEKGIVNTYLHGSRIGVIVALDQKNAELSKDIAMHIAAANPYAVDKSGIALDTLKKQQEIFVAQAEKSGKPAQIIEKMVEGKMNKFIKENTLLGQNFVKNSDITIEQLLKENNNTKVEAFIRYELGEGIEKKVDNFAEEVMSQVQGS